MEKNTKGRKASVKDAIKAGVRPKKTTTKELASEEVAATVVEETPVQKAIKAVSAGKKKAATPVNKMEDNIAALPESKQKVYIKAKAVGETKEVNVNIADITATSQNVYVADIHAQNAQVLATVYWVIMPNTQHVVLRVTKDEYDALMLKKEAKSMKHLYSVIDNAVFPSITYGSWKLSDIKGFPTLDQIDEYDAKFRGMEVNIHNAPNIASIQDDEEEEDDFEIDFEEDEEDEDEFDFEEED